MDDFNVPVDEHKDMMQDEENAFMGYARCSQNIRKVKKKIYGPGDLESKEIQTDVTLPCMFHFQARAPSQQFILNKERDRRMRSLYRQLKRG